MDKKIHEGTMKVGQAHGDEVGATSSKDILDILGSPNGSGWAALVFFLGFNHCIFILCSYIFYLIIDVCFACLTKRKSPNGPNELK